MQNKERIKEALLSTEREGIKALLNWMDENGFYDCPCSGGNHLAVEGGLAEHSLNVYGVMQDMSFLLSSGPEPLPKEMQDAIIIGSLLHDLGKTGDYGKPGYVPNMIKDGRPTKAEPEQKYKQSPNKPFAVNPGLFPVPHEVRSVKIASQFIKLTEEEELAILWHNGLYGDYRYTIQGKETPLYLLLHFADMWASRIMEKRQEEENGECD